MLLNFSKMINIYIIYLIYYVSTNYNYLYSLIFTYNYIIFYMYSGIIFYIYSGIILPTNVYNYII